MKNSIFLILAVSISCNSSTSPSLSNTAAILLNNDAKPSVHLTEKFSIRVLDSSSHPCYNASVSFVSNGIKYSALTDKQGNTTLWAQEGTTSIEVTISYLGYVTTKTASSHQINIITLS